MRCPIALRGHVPLESILVPSMLILWAMNIYGIVKLIESGGYYTILEKQLINLPKKWINILNNMMGIIALTELKIKIGGLQPPIFIDN